MLAAPGITKPKGGPVLRTRRTSSQRSRGTAPWSRSRKRTPAPASTIINLAGLQSPALLFMINRKHEGVGKGDGRQELVVGSPGPRRPGRSRHSRRRRSTHRPCLCSLLSYPCPCPSTEHLCSHGQFLVPCTPSSGAQTCHTRRRDHLSQADTQRIVTKSKGMIRSLCRQERVSSSLPCLRDGISVFDASSAIAKASASSSRRAFSCSVGKETAPGSSGRSRSVGAYAQSSWCCFSSQPDGSSVSRHPRFLGILPRPNRPRSRHCSS